MRERERERERERIVIIRKGITSQKTSYFILSKEKPSISSHRNNTYPTKERKRKKKKS
jgi:hypothetical protein